MPQVDPVILQLKADLDDYQTKMIHAERLASDKLDRIEKRGFEMGQAIKRNFTLAAGAAVAFAGSLAITGVTEAIKSGLEYASTLGEVAQQLGVTTDALQEYRYAATQVGLSQEEMDQALSQLTRRIGEAANGTKAQAEAFKKLGLSVKDAKGNIIATGDAIPMIADALKKVQSPAERAAILLDLFGRAGQKLEPLLAGGSEAVNNLRNAAHDLGIVLSERQIQAADDTADKLEQLKTVLQARVAGVVADNAQAIYRLADSLAHLVDSAIKAAGAWLSFHQAVGAQEEQYKRADAYLAGRKDLSSSARSAAQKRAREIIDERLGLQTETTSHFGGLFKVRETHWKGGKPPVQPVEPAAKTPALLPPGHPAASGDGGAGPKASTSKAGGGASGPSRADILRRFNDELAGLMAQTNSAEGSIARSVEERAEYEARNVELARIRTIDGIKAEKDYSAAQKKSLIAQTEVLASAERERIEFQKKAELERQAQDMADAQNQAQSNLLQSQYDLADSQEERQRLALVMIDLEERYQRSLLEAVIASETATDAEKKKARIALEALGSIEANKRESARRQNAGPLESYKYEIDKNIANINEGIQSIEVEGLKSLNDGIVEAIMGTKSLGDVFKSVANQIIADLLRIAVQKAVIEPLLGGLLGGGGGGGILGGLFGGLFGHAGGGFVQGGQMIRVNEGASSGKVEGFIPQGSGTIVPLGRMNAVAAGGGNSGGVVRIVVEEAEGFATRVTDISTQTAVEVHRVTRPGVVREASDFTLQRVNRPRI